MQEKKDSKLIQKRDASEKQRVYRFSPRTYIKMNGVPIVETEFDQDEVRYFFSEQNVLRSNVAVNLPMPKFKQRDIKPKEEAKGIGLEQKRQVKRKSQSDNRHRYTAHHQYYQKIMDERNLRIIQPTLTRESHTIHHDQTPMVQSLLNRSYPRVMIHELEGKFQFINIYKKHLPVLNPSQKTIIEEKKESRYGINELTYGEHFTLRQKRPFSLQLDKEYWMRQLHMRFYQSLTPVTTSGTLQINGRNQEKKQARRLKFLKVWVQVALTPINFKSWQRVMTSAILGFLAVTSISLLVMTKDMPKQPVNTGLNIYDIYYNGEIIGTTANRVGTKFAYQKIGEQLSEDLGMEVELTHDLIFEPSQTMPENPDGGQRALAGISDQLDYEVYAIEIKMDGESVGVVKDKNSAEQVLEALKQPFIEAISNKASDWSVIGFKENITFEPAFVEKETIKSNDDIVQVLMQVDEEKQTYIVQSGDSVSGIAQKFDLRTEQIMGLNPQIGSDYRLSIGEELVVVQPNYQYTVVTEETVEYNKTLEFETEYIKDNSMYTTQIKTITPGKMGESAVVATIRKENAVEVDRTIVSEVITQEPIKEVLRIGTKEPALFIADSEGTGEYIWPTTGTVSSEFGPRWGGWHSGIDIANSSGTPIYAADSGTVVYSAYNGGGYGNLIKIYHGNGIETRYGHMVKRVAKEGEQVKKGQLIGYMGTTGHSTGNHLHFEVRVGGVANNPRNYLN